MTRFFTLLAVSGLTLLASMAQAQAVYFKPASSYPSGVDSPNELAVGDVNNDGHPDLVVAPSSGGYVSLLLGIGNGTFSEAQPILTAVGNRHIALGDVNQDGLLDLVVEKYPGFDILLGKGDGTFPKASSYATASGFIGINLTLADVNADNRLDLLLCHDSKANVFLNQGGAFGPATLFTFSPSAALVCFKVADMNGDGKPDLLAGTDSYYRIVSVLLGNGNGTFKPYMNFTTGNGFPRQFITADVDGDNKCDVVCLDRVFQNRVVLKGKGDGTFEGPVSLRAGNSTTLAYAASDLNLDGKTDLLSLDGTNDVQVHLGSGNGTFQNATPYHLSPDASVNSILINLVATDVNHDNRPDLLITTGDRDAVRVLLSSATPLPTRAALPGASASLAPNPTEGGAATLTLAGLPAAVARVQATLLDATGRTVARQLLPAAQGTARAEVPTASLPAGLYVLRLAALDAQSAAVGELPAQRLGVR